MKSKTESTIFFASSDNQDWLKENGISEDEKASLCQELKDFISDELKVKCSTKEESDFVEKVKAVFDIDKEKKSADQLKHTLDFVSGVNKYIQKDYNAKDALNAAYNDIAFSDGNYKITNVISEGISTLSDSIDKEKIDEYMQDITANYVSAIDDKDVTPQSFSKNYQANPNALRLEEKEWAHKVFSKMLFSARDEKNGFNIDNIDYTSFFANGEQIISNEELENSKGENEVQAMEAKIAARLAAGDKITVRRGVSEKLIEPDVIFNNSKNKSQLTESISKEKNSESVKQAPDKNTPVSSATDKNSSTKENSDAKDASVKSDADDKTTENTSEKKESQKMPASLEDFLYLLFVKLLDALDKSLDATRERIEKSKKDAQNSKPSRTKTSFMDLMKEEASSKKITVNFKKTHEKAFSEKSASKKERTM